MRSRSDGESEEKEKRWERQGRLFYVGAKLRGHVRDSMAVDSGKTNRIVLFVNYRSVVYKTHIIAENSVANSKK